MGVIDFFKNRFVTQPRNQLRGVVNNYQNNFNQFNNRVVKPVSQGVNQYNQWKNQTNQRFSQSMPKPVSSTFNWVNKTASPRNLPNLASNFTVRYPAQTAMRGIARVRQGMGEDLGTNAWTPSNRFEKLILGNDTINTWGGQRREATKFGTGLGLKESTASKLALPLVAGGAVLDVLPGGGKKKAASYSDDVIKKIAKSNKVDDIIKLGVKKKDAIKLSKITSEKAVKRILKFAEPTDKGLRVSQPVGKGASSSGIRSGRTLPEIAPKTQELPGQAPKLLQKQGGQQLGKLSVAPKGSQKIVLKNPSSDNIIPQVRNAVQGTKLKERGFTSTIKLSDKTPKPLKDMVSGTYVVKSDKTRIADAKSLIRKDLNAAENLALNPRNDTDITIGNELLNNYMSTGQFKKATDLADKMAESGTELGRAVRSFGDYDKTTPEGALRFAQKTIDRYNKSNPHSKLQITDSQVEGLFNKAREIQAMPEGKLRNMKSQELMDDITKLIPSTVTDKLITIWKAGLLTSPRTTMRNVLGNTLHGVAEITKDFPAMINDIVLSSKTGQRSLTATTKGLRGGAKEGVGVAKDIMKYGYDPGDTIKKFDVKKVNWGKGPAGQVAKKYTDFVFNMLAAQDKPFYHAAFARSLYDQAGATAINAGKKGNKQFIENLVKNPSTEMIKAATQDASISTFKNRNILGKVATSFKAELSKSELGKAAGELVAPFTGVPTSIAGQIVAYSPIGLAKGVSTDIKVLTKNLPELQRQASQEIGRGVVGTGLMGLAAYLTSKGLMTGQPKDQAEQRQWELEGKQANSILIGGKWRNINSIGPEALVLLAGSKITSSKDSAQALGNVGKDFLSQTFLAGVQGPLNAITDPARYGQSYLRSQTASGVPNIVKDTAKAFDATARETTTVADSLKASIPGLRNSLLPRRDSLGLPMKQEPTGPAAYIDLFNSKTPNVNPVVDELSRLNNTGFNATPSKINKKQTVNGQKIELTPQELDRFEDVSGEILRSSLTELIRSREYQSLEDDAKANKIDKAVQDARLKAKEMILGQIVKERAEKTSKIKTKKTKKLKVAKAKKGRKPKTFRPSLADKPKSTLSLLKAPKTKVIKLTGGKSGTKKPKTPRGRSATSMYA